MADVGPVNASEVGESFLTYWRSGPSRRFSHAIPTIPVEDVANGSDARTWVLIVHTPISPFCR